MVALLQRGKTELSTPRIASNDGPEKPETKQILQKERMNDDKKTRNMDIGTRNDL